MDKKLFMIGNAHLDPVWMWRWTDGYAAVQATFRSVLERMKEFPDFIFTSAAACYYEWVEHCDPEMFGEIVQRVKEGRWRITGGWWIQPDCNVLSGESFARQALIGQRYFMEKFGVRARTGYNVDSFGHNGSLPKILRLSGMDRYVYMRPGVHERSYPAWTFRWQGPEGDAVTAYRIPFEYCTWPDEIEAHINRCANEISGKNGMMCFYGVGNHGGGPTIRNIESIHSLNHRNGTELILASPDDFFDQVDEARLPVVNGELLHHASGCYAAHSAIKRMNRKAENALLQAEKWMTAAHLLSQGRDRSAELKAAWKKVLFNQFHDILAGTSIQEAYEDAGKDYAFAMSAADDVANEGMQSLSRLVRIPFVENSQPYIVMNPQGFDAEYPVSIEMADFAKAYVLTDDQGSCVAFQLAQPSAAAFGRKKLCFVAKVPAMGWRVYRLTAAEAQENVEEQLQPSFRLENEWTYAEFDPSTGEMISIRKKVTGEEILRKPTGIRVFADDSDTWSHAKYVFDGPVEPVTLEEIRVVEDGPVRKTIRVRQRVGSSTILREYTLYQALPEILVHTDVDWQETQKCLKFSLPMNYNYLHVRAQAPYGFADRELDGEEYPMQQWLDATGCSDGMTTLPSGLAVLNDGKYAYDAHDRTLFLTVLRSPYYANHEPYIARPEENYPVIDRGVQHFTYALLPHEGNGLAAAELKASMLNMPPVILPAYAHEGPLPAEGGVLTLQAEHTVLDAMKLSEDSSSRIILHFHEVCREQEECMLRIPALKIEHAFSMQPGQIRCFMLDTRSGAVEDCDLLENPV